MSAKKTHCKKCGGTEFSHRDGRLRCIPCERERGRIKAEKRRNQPDYRSKANAYRSANAERMRAYDRDWKKKRRAENPDAARELARKYQPYRTLWMREWRVKHPGYSTPYTREWRKRNPEAYRSHWLHHRHRRRARLESVECTLTKSEWEQILAKHEHRCAYCGSTNKIEQDHIVPISRGGGHVASNVVPACRSCNRRKHAKTPEEWKGVTLADSKLCVRRDDTKRPRNGR